VDGPLGNHECWIVQEDMETYERNLSAFDNAQNSHPVVAAGLAMEPPATDMYAFRYSPHV
jgi:hypothetical protein